MTTTPPILFIIFNRADLTARVFQRIRESRPAFLYIAADGPREGREGEEECCQKARFATEEVDWPCQVFRLYRNQNLGCKLAVSTAITWFFDNVESGVILEDDCLPDLTFFRFASEMLTKYANDPRVLSVSGKSFICNNSNQAASYYFSKYIHIWGWASWRRAWEKYDVNMSSWEANRECVMRHVSNKRYRKRIDSWLEAVYNNKTDTWDYQLLYASLLNNCLNVMPFTNMIENIGFDGRATHTVKTRNKMFTQKTCAIRFPLSHPAEIFCDADADDQFFRNSILKDSSPVWIRLLKSISRRFGFHR